MHVKRSENGIENSKLLNIFSFLPRSPHIGFIVNTRLQLGGKVRSQLKLYQLRAYIASNPQMLADF